MPKHGKTPALDAQGQLDGREFLRIDAGREMK
jgi:hypothetical protein